MDTTLIVDFHVMYDYHRHGREFCRAVMFFAVSGNLANNIVLPSGHRACSSSYLCTLLSRSCHWWYIFRLSQSCCFSIWLSDILSYLFRGKLLRCRPFRVLDSKYERQYILDREMYRESLWWHLGPTGGPYDALDWYGEGLAPIEDCTC